MAEATTTETETAEATTTEEESLSSGVIEGVQEGAAPVYTSGAMDLNEVGVVSLDPAPMPQYQMAVDSGLDPVVPEDAEEESAGQRPGFNFLESLGLDKESRAARHQRAAREVAEKRDEHSSKRAENKEARAAKHGEPTAHRRT